MLPSALQLLALALALLGVLGAGLATLSPAWRGRSAGAGGGLLAAVWQQQGLWADCSWHATGVFSCSLAPSVLALPAPLQAARVAMVTALLLGALGLSLAALGLKCTRWGGGRRAKGLTAVAAGGCLVMAGTLCLLAAGWVTSDLLRRFTDPRVPTGAKQEPGAALYLAFISAALLLTGGGIFCLSCPGMGQDRSPASSSGLHAAPVDPPLVVEEEGARQEDPPPDTPAPRDTPHYSPSKLPAKDIQAGYTLKDYV